MTLQEKLLRAGNTYTTPESPERAVLEKDVSQGHCQLPGLLPFIASQEDGKSICQQGPHECH